MPLPPRNCPECRTRLDGLRVPNSGLLRCPGCGSAIYCFPPDESDATLQLEPVSARPLTVASRSSRSYPEQQKVTSIRKKPSSSLGVLVAVGVGLGMLGLLIIGGSVGTLVYFTMARGTPTTKTVAEAPVAEMPVAHFNPNPAPAASLPVKPLPPPKEPIQPAPQEAGQQPQVGRLPLKELKAASVYIKCETATMQARGSGFVVRAQGDMAYVVTNHHVISPPVEQGNGPLPPFVIPRPPIGPQFPRPPFGPRMPGPIGPRMPRRGIALLQPGGQLGVSLTVIFYSGTNKEQSLPATVLGDDAQADLAVLRVNGVRDVPSPIDCQVVPELIETTPAIAFGYPFGEKLDPNGKNPAVTVTKGAISSLRSKNGELDEVQLDLDLNPGNSGGPVVDEKGTLVGVAVAKVKNSRIGFAVPVHKLKRLLQRL
jgi:S1-C subfamily serine protease